MGKKLYVGNLAYGVTDSDLRRIFEECGAVQSTQVIIDRDSGRSKGFGFVEMSTVAEAELAIATMNGKEVQGQVLTVNDAKPKKAIAGARGGGGYAGDRRGGYDGRGRY